MSKPIQFLILATLSTIASPKIYTHESPRIQVCTEPNFSGKCKFHDVKKFNECQNLPPDINNAISSVIIHACFIFYKDPDCKGPSTSVQEPGECNIQDPNCCPSHDFSYCNGFNDAISSFMRCKQS